MPKTLDSDEAVRSLAQRLAELESVRQHDSEEGPEGERLAASLAHIEEACEAFLNRLPVLAREGITSEQRWGILHDIGEDIRHLVWHLHNTAYYEHVVQAVLAEE
jgi:hypothetical protein